MHHLFISTENGTLKSGGQKMMTRGTPGRIQKSWAQTMPTTATKTVVGGYTERTQSLIDAGIL